MVLGVHKWKTIDGIVTPGGEPCYVCPNCGGDRHLYGVENSENYHHECKECKTKLIYPWENEEIKYPTIPRCDGMR